MKPTLVAAIALSALAACGTPPNPTILRDAQLIVAGLEAVDTAVAQFPGVPAADTILAGLVLTAVQAGLTELQNGAKTPADFATLAQTQIGLLAPPLLKDLHANATITTGVALLQGLIPVIAAEATPAPAAMPVAAMASDTRGKLQAWVRTVKG